MSYGIDVMVLLECSWLAAVEDRTLKIKKDLA